MWNFFKEGSCFSPSELGTREAGCQFQRGTGSCFVNFHPVAEKPKEDLWWILSQGTGSIQVNHNTKYPKNIHKKVRMYAKKRCSRCISFSHLYDILIMLITSRQQCLKNYVVFFFSPRVRPLTLLANIRRNDDAVIPRRLSSGFPMKSQDLYNMSSFCHRKKGSAHSDLLHATKHSKFV